MNAYSIPVNAKISKLLKEKGFNKPTEMCVSDDDDRPMPFDAGRDKHKNSLHPYYYSSPTITEALDWLWMEHDVFICIRPTSLGDIAVFIEDGFGEPLYQKHNHNDIYENALTVCYTTKDALEEGIIYSLTKVI